MPELAKALADKIKQAHKDNTKFQAAFDDFFDALPDGAQSEHQPGGRR